MPHVKFHMFAIGVIGVLFFTLAGCAVQSPPVKGAHSPGSPQSFDEQIQINAKRMLEEGKQIFRFDTFGSEDFWGGKLRLHEALAGAKLGGVGNGVVRKRRSRWA